MQAFTTYGDSIFLGLFALVILIISAEIAVKKILALATYYKISSTFAGLSIFSLSTSFPEIIAHITASVGIVNGTLDFKIASATVLGANIGSDVVQQTLMLGLFILIMGGITFTKKFLTAAYAPMIGTTLLCIVLGYDEMYSRLDGFLLLSLFIAYMFFLYRKGNDLFEDYLRPKKQPHLLKDTVIAVLCLITTLLSAQFLLLEVENIVDRTGIGSSLIGVFTIGIASASPEFFTAVFGIRQKAPGVSLGTLIGSNIVNPLVAIGGGAMISTYWVPRPLIIWDLSMETITAALLLAYLVYSKGKLQKSVGVYLILLYIIYAYVRIQFFSLDSW